MHKGLLIAATIAAVFLIGCVNESMLEPESAPGYKYRMGRRPATVREADNCFVRSFDGLDVTPLDESGVYVLSMPPVTYRQFHISPGVHTLMIAYYQRQGSNGSVRGGPVPVRVKLEANHLYTIDPNRNEFFVQIGPFTTGRWHPDLVDQATQKAAITVSSAQ